MDTKVSNHELTAVSIITDRLANLQDEELTDTNSVLRFLRAQNLDMGRTEQMIRKSAKWREDNKISRYQVPALQSEIPKVLLEDFRFELIGNDHDGHPVFYVPIGRWNIRDMYEDYHQEILKCRFYLFESLMVPALKASGKDTLVAIFDLTDLSLYKVAHLGTTNLFIQVIRDFEENYPERAKSIILINASWVFYYAFSLIKRWVPVKTLGKMHVYGEDKSKWLPVLKKYVKEDQLPSELI